MIRVAIADDHHLVRQGIRALLEKNPDVKVISESENGQEAVEAVEKDPPDVLVMDIAMPRLNGIQALERIRSLDLPTQVVMLSMYSDEALVLEALKKGARGYLLKRSVKEELIIAVRSAVDGNVYLSPAISGTVLANYLAGLQPETQADQLTSREREVLQLIYEGHTNRAISEMLQVSIKTVEKHRTSLMAKLGVNDLAGLIRVAIKKGLIIPTED